MIRGKPFFILSSILLLACAAYAEKDDDAVVVSPVVTSSAAPISSDKSTTEPSVAEVVGCEGPNMDRTQRLAVIAKLVLNLESELEKNPDSIKDADTRAKMGIFIAGSMSDSTRFISLDRSCWANFYEAQSKLAADDDKAANEAATRWMTCLSDFFPDRIETAKPYQSCFPAPEPKTKRPNRK